MDTTINNECLNCHNETSLFLRAQDYNRKISKKEFAYYRCDDCGYLFLDPIPENLMDYYPNDYYGPTPKDATSLLEAARIYEGYKIDLVTENCPDIETVLEVGPSMGGFALLCKDKGLKVRTIEMSEKCANFLNQQAKIPTKLTANEIRSIKEEPKADLVALWHVIEHVKDPFKLIDVASDRVNNGGYLLIAAPNPRSIQFSILKRNWVHLDAPRHVCFLPLPLLKERLRKNGFSVVLSTTQDTGSLGWTSMGWKTPIERIIKGKPAKTLGSLITRFFQPFEKSLNKGSCYTVIAKKND